MGKPNSETKRLKRRRKMKQKKLRHVRNQLDHHGSLPNSSEPQLPAPSSPIDSVTEEGHCSCSNKKTVFQSAM